MLKKDQWWVESYISDVIAAGWQHGDGTSWLTKLAADLEIKISIFVVLKPAWCFITWCGHIAQFS